MLRFYNTLTRKKEKFESLKEDEVGFYSCGPTVYWYQHIGNLRTYIFNDILKRVLSYENFNVKHVMNVTDVGHLTTESQTGEDIVLKRACLEKKTPEEIANFFTAAFLKDEKKLNIIPADYFPKQSEAGHMVIRYGDSSPVVNFLNSEKRGGDTLFTLPAHTLLYRQTNITPFNKFLFYLPWMERSPILFPRLIDSFRDRLPTFIFIDSIHFPYFPPEEIRRLLVNYREVKVTEAEPPVYILKTYKESP